MGMIGILYIVATPIGNLSDITLRALEVLKSVDLVLCEDTRVTKKLLTHFDISTPTKSFHQHSGAKIYREVRELLEEGKNLALVSDAGTPGISDPGNTLVNYLVGVDKAVQIIPIPGPSAVISALSVSGFPTDKFVFLGFPPHKKGRAKYFEQVAAAEYTTVFYESSHRIKKTLVELQNILEQNGALNDNEVCIGREITKKFETFYRGTINDIIDSPMPDKGEFVVMVRGKY